MRLSYRLMLKFTNQTAAFRDVEMVARRGKIPVLKTWSIVDVLPVADGPKMPGLQTCQE